MGSSRRSGGWTDERPLSVSERDAPVEGPSRGRYPKGEVGSGLGEDVRTEDPTPDLEVYTGRPGTVSPAPDPRRGRDALR